MNRSATRIRYSRRVTIGIATAIVACLWGSVQYYRLEASYQQQYPDAYTVAAQVARLEPFAAAVPEDSILGYLTDVEQGSDIDSVMINTAAFVLAPRLIDRAAGHPWVLGNFLRPADFMAVGRNHGLRLERDFGGGVVLYRSTR